MSARAWGSKPRLLAAGDFWGTSGLVMRRSGSNPGSSTILMFNPSRKPSSHPGAVIQREGWGMRLEGIMQGSSRRVRFLSR